MARIRSIHPGIFTDEDFVSLSAHTRLFFIGLWTEADDQGIFAWKPLTLKMRLAPADAVDAAAMLAELVAVGCVRQFTVSDRPYGAIKNFRKAQRPDKPNAIHPAPDEIKAFVGMSGASHTGSDKAAPAYGGRTITEEAAPDPLPVEQHSPTSRGEVGEQSESDPRKFGQMERRGEESRGEKNRSLRSLVQKLPPEADFEAFWCAYPRREAKARAVKAWAAAINRAAPEEILAGLRGFRWPDDPRFIPLPASWLNAQRWLDEAPPERRSLAHRLLDGMDFDRAGPDPPPLFDVPALETLSMETLQ
jgi:hypothetical protein